MSNIADQVADLAYLVDSPIATPYPPIDRGSLNGQGGRNSSAESPAESGKKRKADNMEGGTPTTMNNVNGNDSGGGNVNGGSNGTTQTRAKRNRYISIACNECKRRKIKCNGNTPCQRCGNLNLECQYAPNCCTNGFKESEEFRQMNSQLASLQEQVDNLYANLSALRSGQDGIAFAPPSERSMSITQNSQAPQSIPSASRYRPTSKHKSYHGPTSSAFGLDVANTTLHNMGYPNLNVDETAITQDSTPVASPPTHSPISPPLPTGHRRDPIWALSKQEMIRLCRVYEEEMGIMYPVVDIEQVIVHGTNLYTFVDAAMRNGLGCKTTDVEKINDEGTCVLKMVLACSTLTEGHGRSEIAYRLFESVREAANGILHGEVINVKDLPFLVLVAIYHFHCDEEALAWRIIGQVARMCVELGLHRRDSLFKVITDEQERASALNIFWSIYVLDRRWSFGTGMPFALQDTDIDPNLPEPQLNSPYLHVMIAYYRIGSKVWRSVTSFSPSPSVDDEEIGYLDYQILQWQKSIPEDLQLPTSASPPTSSRAIQRLQILLYLRANQMRILIYRPVLHTASSIQQHLSYASTVVELAKDTIRALTHLNRTSDIYRSQQVCFNYFLTSAIAVLFLASCHAPATFSSICREEFYMALDLVKGFSCKSWVTRRLWRIVKGLKEIGPRVGLVIEPVDPHSSAALTMAGLAGHEISNLGPYGEGNTAMGVAGTGNRNSPNGFQMSHDMTSLFEAALGSVGIHGSGAGAGNAYAAVQDVNDNLVGGGSVGSNVFGGDEELYRQLRDLF